MKSAIIVAGGSSQRYGKNKLNEDLLGQTVLQRAINVFSKIADEIVVVTNEDVALGGVKVVRGGETRSLSVMNGLNAVSDKSTTVAVHDGARPFVSRSLVEKLFYECEKYGSAVPCVKVSDTLWHGTTPANRDEFVTVQTPQVFDTAKLKKAFETEGDFTDESTRFAKVYGEVHFVEGERTNTKVTYIGDVCHYSVGNGFDVHAFGEGKGVTLGGIEVPYEKSLVGHSDADVVLHAICDAVLSASNNRDIGVQFPCDDDKYLGIDSKLLLNECVNKAREKGFEVANVTAVVICQQPKLSPYVEKMQQSIANVLAIAESSVSISATTTEHLGALGNGDGIACQAVALLQRTGQ